MAIKAIVNNTEKEIEQIKNSDEQDIDYVYSRIGDTEVEGALPISIKSIGGNLSNYRIYGNTENGESVGDKTANLFDMSDFNPNNVTVNDDGSFYIGWNSTKWAFSCKVETGKTYFISWEELNKNQNDSWLSIAVKAGYHVGFSYPCYITTLKNSPPNVWYKLYVVFTATDDYLSIDGMGTYIRNIMLVEGSTAMDYEPYGYKIPITNNSETANIYLDEPLAKSGDIADYIDYAAQKRHNSDGTESSVKLPEIAVAVGTNILTVNTSIQPSNIYIKDSFDYKKVFTATRVIEDGLPLNYKSIEDSDSTLKNYRIYGNTETKTRSYSGTAPLSFPIVDGAVSNYRVYGNTVGGESVGDRTGNLFDINSPLLYNASISRQNVDDTTCIFPYGVGGNRRCIFIPVEPNTTYTFSCRTAGDKLVIATYNQRYTKAQLDLYTTDNRLISDGEIIFNIQKGYKLYTFTTPATTNMIGIYYQLNISATDIMLNQGSTALPYEPYGYRIPITNNSETANIYLDELLTKSGDNADYIDYAEQKRYNADGTSEDVTLPAFPAQSTLNSLSVGTIIQPSIVAVDVDEVVSCGDRTANILPLSRTPKAETHGDFLCEYDGLGTITLTTDKDNATTDGEFVIPLIHDFTIPVSVEAGGTGCLQMNNDTSLASAENALKFYYNNTYIDRWSFLGVNRTSSSYWDMSNKTINAISVVISNGESSRKITIRPAFVENTTVQVPFEPYGYRIPVTNNSETANIYLDTPLAKSGDIADYIDYAAQRRYNADGTESSATLPALPTFAGTNTLSVGTEIEPSNIYIKGKIKSLD